MKKQTLLSCFRDHLDETRKKKGPGPYLLISGQHGCDDYEVGLLLAEKLNERDEQHPWKVYYKELLKQLAEDMGITEEILERERFANPGFLNNFLIGLKKHGIPDRMEINNNITHLVRTIAFEGFCVIIEQSTIAATSDIDNGLSVRIEAPKDWRMARICHKESLDVHAAKEKIEKIDQQWARLHDAFELRSRREPAFNLVLDNSLFSKEMITELVLKAMEEKGIIEKPAIKMKKNME